MNVKDLQESLEATAKIGKNVPNKLLKKMSDLKTVLS